MKRLFLVAIPVVALLLTACIPGKPSPNPPLPLQGFDACSAPSSSTMLAWDVSSPFTSMGVYIGGVNRGCAQPNLTASWVSSTTASGWWLIPIWVGLQAPCSSGVGVTMSGDPQQTAQQGVAQANAAADAASALGMNGAPIYYDMEAYPRGGSCSYAVQNFMTGWTIQLHNRGYTAGFYSSLCSGVLDLAAVYGSPGFVVPDDVWIAAWNNTPNLTGFSCPPSLSDSFWANHQRVHQYRGGHNETWGGVTINIDSNAEDGKLYP